MGVEENKALVRRLVDAVDRGELDALDEIFAPDVANHALGGIQTGLGAVKAIAGAVHSTFPDAVSTIEDLIAEGDKVVLRRTLRGTHQGSALPMFAGIDPAGKSVEWQFIHIYRIENGKIADHWAQRNDLEVRRQLEGS